ncbi:hypothetical protein L7F22_035311 [Adiantum nelumboides]|nr:hypothetical protein [Adiantum nelumboides]
MINVLSKLTLNQLFGITGSCWVFSTVAAARKRKHCQDSGRMCSDSCWHCSKCSVSNSWFTSASVRMLVKIGKVICPSKLDANTYRFCVLWDIDVPTPEGITVNFGDPLIRKRPFKLKWGKFANSCFDTGKFGHMQSECPQPVLQPPPSVVPQLAVSNDKQASVSKTPPTEASALPDDSPSDKGKTNTVNSSKSSNKGKLESTLDVKKKGKIVETEKGSTWVSPKKTAKTRPQFSSRNYVPPAVKSAVQKLLPCNDNRTIADAWNKVVNSYRDAKIHGATTSSVAFTSPQVGIQDAAIERSCCKDVAGLAARIATIRFVLPTAEQACWDVKDAHVHALITLSMKHTITSHICSTKSAKQSWHILASLYAGRDEAKIVLLSKELKSKIMNEEDDMDTFLTCFNDINEQLIFAGEVISDSFLV